MQKDFSTKIIAILQEKGSVTTRAIADEFDISRNYAHILLQRLREEGRIVLVGQTNRARYFLTTNTTALRKAHVEIRHIFFRLPNKQLSEDSVFQRIEKETGILTDIKKNVLQIFRHGFTKMLNNAIDHSQSALVEIDCRKTDTALTFVIRDRGIGIFNNVRNKLRLPGTLVAIQEILKGKTTTSPKEHTGEGVFFTSKMADIFIIDSFEKRLTINNLVPDVFISDRKSLHGTRVSFSIHLSSTRDINDVYGVFTGETEDGFMFDKTQITISLYQFGKDLPSRSEAKRVTMNLENFHEIEFDFSNVQTVGQGFADEIFRVWHNRHPNIKLIATHTNENVALMIQRAGGELGTQRPAIT
ncbi:MAG: DUF4325 domain-containing protein [bacterium]|nr:DUF4325 domain-containing protein [bacterium]